MAMSQSLREYLETRGVEFELVEHPRALTSAEVAAAAHVPGDLLAKTVIVENADEPLAVVVPSTKHVDLTAVRERLGKQCGLATEDRIESIFKDCETGAIPAVPQAFGLKVMIDDALKGLDEVYFPAGEHTKLAHLSGEDFATLMSNAEEGSFTESWPS